MLVLSDYISVFVDHLTKVVLRNFVYLPNQTLNVYPLYLPSRKPPLYVIE